MELFNMQKNIFSRGEPHVNGNPGQAAETGCAAPGVGRRRYRIGALCIPQHFEVPPDMAVSTKSCIVPSALCIQPNRLLLQDEPMLRISLQRLASHLQ
jgi:hypothetical protein